MTATQLLALGAPPLPAGLFYRVRSTADGFVYVSIRRVVTPPGGWPAWLWRSSRRIKEVLAHQTSDPRADIVEACRWLTDWRIANTLPDPYWSVIADLSGDHR